MYVQYKCDCGAEVNSNMEHCPQCGAELPDFSLDQDHDAEAVVADENEADDEELEPPTADNSLRDRFIYALRSYLRHLRRANDIDVREQEEIAEKIAQIQAEGGPWAVRWYKFKRFLLFTLGIIAFFAWMVIGIGLLDQVGYFEGDQQIFLGLFLVSLFPLYLVSIWLVVKHDDRPLPLWQKILQSLWGAANRLTFAFLFLVIGFLVVQTMIDFVISGLFG